MNEKITTMRKAIKWGKDNLVSLAAENFLKDTDAFQLKGVGVHKLQDSYGRNLLHHLAFKGSIPAMSSCLALKVFSLNDLDRDYNTPLHYFMMSEQFDLHKLKVLLETFKGDVFAKNIHGVTPLNLLHAFDDQEAQRLYYVQMETIQFSKELYIEIKHGKKKANIKPVLGFVDDGKLPFQDGKPVVNHIASLYFRHYKTKRTPLHMAVINENFEAVKILLEAGANPNARDKEGNTPLHLAVQCKDEYKILDCLLKNRANRDVKNKAGQTPAEYAAALNLKVAEMKIRWKDRQYQLKYCQKLSWPSTDVEWEEVINDAKRFRLAWSKKLLELMIKQLDVYLNGTCWASYFISSKIRHSKQATEIKAELKKILNGIDAMIEVIAIAHEKDKKEDVVVAEKETLDQLIKGSKTLNENSTLDMLCTNYHKYFSGDRLVSDLYEILNSYMRGCIKQDFIKRDKVPNGVFMISLRYMMLNLQQCQKKNEAIDLKSAGDGGVGEATLTKK